MTYDPGKTVREEEAIGARHAGKRDRPATGKRLGHTVHERGLVSSGETAGDVRVGRGCLDHIDARDKRVNRRRDIRGGGAECIPQNNHLRDGFARIDESIIVRRITIITEDGFLHQNSRWRGNSCRREQQCISLRRRRRHVVADDLDGPIPGGGIGVSDNLLDDVEMVFLVP